MAQEAHDQARLDAELFRGVADRASQPFQHGRERDAARRVALRVEKHLDVAHVVGVRALEIGPGKVIKILLRDQHGHALIIDVEKILQIAEAIGLPHRVDRRVWQADAVAPRQRKHQLRLEAAFDMDVQLAFGKSRDQGIRVRHLRHSLRREGRMRRSSASHDGRRRRSGCWLDRDL